MLTILGGTYYEVCVDSGYKELFGSGLRGAIAISGKGFLVKFFSYVGEKDLRSAESICRTYGIEPSFLVYEDTISFIYQHALSSPSWFPDFTFAAADGSPIVESENILYYGFLEGAQIAIGNYVVYDPQNKLSFRATGSKAKHLAIILNKGEAQLLSELNFETDIATLGAAIREMEGAEVVVIKDGPRGAFVFDSTAMYQIPVFETPTVWPIGSGDIFSAVFAWKWIFERKAPQESAYWASRYTAHYCSTLHLPLLTNPIDFNTRPIASCRKRIYIAAPFFTIGERWVVNELKSALEKFGNEVFSPFHEVGLGLDEQIYERDIEGLEQADVITAIMSGLDAGTIFEIGYAKAKGKKIVIYAENVAQHDLLMMKGAGCEIAYDIATTVYKSSW